MRSGARTTATSAAALGKELMAVPGPITSAMSLGCHEYLRSGTAVPVNSVTEILESISHGAEDIAPRYDTPTRATNGPGDQAARVYAALGSHTGRWPGRIAVESAVPVDSGPA